MQSVLSENFQFLEVKFSIYLNRRVFVMDIKFYLQTIFDRAGIAPVSQYSFGFLHMGACSISSQTDDPDIKNLITNCVVNRLMSILFSFQSRNFIKLNKSKY